MVRLLHINSQSQRSQRVPLSPSRWREFDVEHVGHARIGRIFLRSGGVAAEQRHHELNVMASLTAPLHRPFHLSDTKTGSARITSMQARPRLMRSAPLPRPFSTLRPRRGRSLRTPPQKRYSVCRQVRPGRLRQSEVRESSIARRLRLRRRIAPKITTPAAKRPQWPILDRYERRQPT
jgi:hypothetical protein